jgi:hypothetical protein
VTIEKIIQSPHNGDGMLLVAIHVVIKNFQSLVTGLVTKFF